MRIKELFTVPEEKKVTEKVFGRVLVSSICSVLICMACLASTTWAWFAVSIENTENVTQIGSPKVLWNVNVLPDGTHKVSITHAGASDDLQRKSTLYVTLTINGTNSVYTILNFENDYRQEIEVHIGTDKHCNLSCEASWFAPANAGLLVGNTINIAAEESTKSTTAPAASQTALSDADDSEQMPRRLG